MKKIAILGGGLGALSTAFALTEEPDWKDRYEITVYQLGWRLGGKGASGRNPEACFRIEEHGLHIWMGFYHDAFRMMRRCYEELDRPPGAPLRTWDEAFRPHSDIVLQEFIAGSWEAWPIRLPTNDGVPGAECTSLTSRLIEDILRWMVEAARSLEGRLAGEIVVALDASLHRALELARALGEDPSAHPPAILGELIALLGRLVDGLLQCAERFLQGITPLRRLFLLMNLGCAMLLGCLKDQVFAKGFVVIDDLDFRDWLGRNGAHPQTLSSAPVRGLYNLIFASIEGDPSRPALSAGTGLQIVLSMLLKCQGAVMYKMAAGMGDTAIAPLYLVLRQRGVQFRFFHRIQSLGLSPDERSIEVIRMARQVNLEGPDYQPLIDVKGLPCWPSRPLYEQIQQPEREALIRQKINLESTWADWKPVAELELRRGADFDVAVLGISVGALRGICTELIEARPEWRDMVDQVATVETQALQLWLAPSLREMGWKGPSPVSGGGPEPMDTWADMSELLPREDWPADGGPRTILYLCGSKCGGPSPPPADTGYPERERWQGRWTFTTWLESNCGASWPEACESGNPAGLDWSLLYASPESGAPPVGQARLLSQYLRVNIDPSERYVLSLPGTARYRLRADGSGFDNLFLAGDWVATNLNAGCVESAVESGLAAARGILRPRRKVAVLGGGAGALSAAWTLAQPGAPGTAYDITVYQMGWRLGGKGASGRNRERGDRIEEHGLHVWAGFYENAFRMMRECYDALPPDPENPLKTVEDAFKKHSDVALMEWIREQWLSWPVTFPENDEIPGTGGELPTPWGYLQLLLDWLVQQSEGVPRPPSIPLHETLAGRLRNGLHRLKEDAVQIGEHLSLLGPEVEGEEPVALRALPVQTLLRTASSFAASLSKDSREHRAIHHASLLELIEAALHRLEDDLAAAAPAGLPEDLRRLILILNLGCANARGLLADGVVLYGFEAINGSDWRDWLRCHGAWKSTLDSTLVRSTYNYVFGFVGGRAGEPQIEAGTAVHGLLRLFFTYKGALFWEMQGGMGDVVFAPFYRALRERGVSFAFFHKILSLGLSPDGTAVDRIEMLRQAVPLAGAYEPLINVRGVPCWPATPLYEQLVDGDKLRGINLESAWAPQVGERIVLERGRDFDDVVLGLSVGALRDACGELIESSPRFRAMCEKVQTAQTASMQLWLDPAAQELGAPTLPRIVNGYANDQNIWSDMSFLLARESWPAEGAPRFLAYFCGPFSDAEEIPPYSDHGFPQRELERFRRDAAVWLAKNTGVIWTRATAPGDPAALDLQLLHAPPGAVGPERLQVQYFRVNIDPTERYVLSLPGTSKHRLAPGSSGFANLYLAGDWVRTSMNAGCIEAAVMGGLAAAAALSGRPILIVGGLP